MILTDDATRHDWDLATSRCKSCGVSKEFVARYGETYCRARYGDAGATESDSAVETQGNP